jgi:endonuclease/exonuclease/phosphatase family metal-dependent hydrolase
MFPEYVGVNRDNYGRVAGIVSGLLALEVDVVMLQEVWDSAPFTAFTGNLSSTLPYIADITPAVLLPNRSLTSGLWFGSRYPILLQDFHQYDNAGPYEELASKGVYGALLNVSGTLTLAFNTHLYSPDGTSDGSVRALQLQEARLFIDSMLNQSQSYGVVSHIVWGGDFNTAESDTSQYQTLLSTTNAFDLFRAAYPSEPGYTFSSWNPSKRIDYIFAIDSNASVTVNNASVQCFAGYIGPSNSSYNPCLSLEAQSCCSACEAASDATHSCGWCEGSGSAAVNLCLDSALLNSFCSSASGVVKDNCSAPAPEPDCQELYHDCASCIAAVSLRANDTACVWCGSDGAPGICLTNLPYASIICTIGVNGSLYGEPFNSTCPTGAQPTPVGPSCPTPSPPSGVTDTTSLSSAVSSVGNSTNTGNSNEGSNSSSFSVEASKCGGLDHCGLWALVAIGLLVLLLMIVALIVAMVVKRGKSPSTNDESPEGSSSSDYDEE